MYLALPHSTWNALPEAMLSSCKRVKRLQREHWLSTEHGIMFSTKGEGIAHALKHRMELVHLETSGDVQSVRLLISHAP